MYLTPKTTTLTTHPNKKHFMHPHLRLLIYGILTWLIPFIFSLFLYGPDGTLTIGIFAFKSLMIISGAASGALLIYLT